MDEDDKLLLMGEIRGDITHNKAAIAQIQEDCRACLVKRIVYGVVAVMGLAVVGALIALVIKGQK